MGLHPIRLFARGRHAAPIRSIESGMEQLSPASPWFPFVSVDPERLGGEPVFRGTRVPVKALFDYVAGGYDLATFLDHFEGVTREQALAVFELSVGGVVQTLRAA